MNGLSFVLVGVHFLESSIEFLGDKFQSTIMRTLFTPENASLDYPSILSGRLLILPEDTVLPLMYKLVQEGLGWNTVLVLNLNIFGRMNQHLINFVYSTVVTRKNYLSCQCGQKRDSNLSKSIP